MAATVAAARAGVILMHSAARFSRSRRTRHADYGGDVVGGVLAELREALNAGGSRNRGPTPPSSIPGFGFSKTVEQNLVLFDQLAALQALGRPILVGPSRKRFLGSAAGACRSRTGTGPPRLRARSPTSGERRLFRVHDVAGAREALALAQAVGGDGVERSERAARPPYRRALAVCGAGAARSTSSRWPPRSPSGMPASSSRRPRRSAFPIRRALRSS